MKISLCIKPHCEDIAIKNIHADNKYDVIFACVSGKTVRTRSLVFQFSQSLVPSLKCTQAFIRFQLTKINKVSTDLRQWYFLLIMRKKNRWLLIGKHFGRMLTNWKIEEEIIHLCSTNLCSILSTVMPHRGVLSFESYPRTLKFARSA